MVHGFVERREVDVPSVVVNQGIGNQLHVLQVGEKFKQRITGVGNENFVVGIAEQAEDIRVALAGAGGEDHGFGIDVLVLRTVIICDSFAGATQAFGLRVVLE